MLLLTMDLLVSEDKIQQLTSVSKNGVTLANNESLRDTLIDLHNYADMAIMLLDEGKEEKTENLE